MEERQDIPRSEEARPEKIQTEENTGEQEGFLKKRIVSVVVSAMVATILICGYVMMALYYSERFFPGTTVNGSDCGNLDAISTMARLKIQTQDYRLEVLGRDLKTEEEVVLGTITAQEIGRHVTVKESDVFQLIRRQNEWIWPVFLWSGDYAYTLEGAVSVDENRLNAVMEEIPAFQDKNMKKPENAYIKGYSETAKRYVTMPETIGTKLEREAAKTVILNALLSGQLSVDLVAAGCYAEADIKEDNAHLQSCLSQANQYLNTQITYDWNGNEVLLTGDKVKDWMTLENGRVVLDEAAVREFVDINAQNYDTYGKERTFMTTLGVELRLPGGAYGWRTDREAETEELIDLIRKGSISEREPVYANEGACKGMDDIGNSYVEADLSHQHLYLYQDGELQLETDFVSGDLGKGKRTPPGVFGVTYKTRNAVLRGADYETPVKYWMPFNGNIGMHDATWRQAFGGEIYKTNGSHGCINLPLKKAAEIYEYVSKGFPVVCYYYSQEEMDILHNSFAQEPVQQEDANEQPPEPQQEQPPEPQQEQEQPPEAQQEQQAETVQEQPQE